VGVRQMNIDSGAPDYLLFMDDKACSIIEFKREGIVEMQFWVRLHD